METVRIFLHGLPGTECAIRRQTLHVVLCIGFAFQCLFCCYVIETESALHEREADMVKE